MMFWLRFALRSVVRRYRRTRITFISVGFGIAMLIVLGAIMVGVNDTMIRNAVALQSGHIAVDSSSMPLDQASASFEHWTEQVANADVEALVPRFSIAALLRHHQTQRAIQLIVIDPALEQRWSPVPATVVQGHWLQDRDGIVLGSGAARELGIEVDDMVLVATAEKHTSLRVVGIFQTGVQSLDLAGGYLALATAQQRNLGDSVRIQAAVFVPAATPLEPLRRNLQAAAPQTFKLTTWREKLPEVEQLVHLNEFSMQIMMALVIVILGFGVANSLLISVMDRYRYYGILKALGVRPREVITTVVAEAVILCLGAGLLGTLLGVLISLGWGHVGLDISRYTSYNPHFSVDPMIYPRLKALMVFLPQTLALISAVIASLWPALVAARRGVSSSMREL